MVRDLYKKKNNSCSILAIIMKRSEGLGKIILEGKIDGR